MRNIRRSGSLKDVNIAKRELKPLLRDIAICIDEKDYYGCIEIFHSNVIAKKPNFPVVEYAARKLFEQVPNKLHFAFTDKLLKRKEAASAVAAATGLQVHLGINLEETIVKTITLIGESDSMLRCDQLSRRVLGSALTQYPDIVLPVLPSLADEDGKWNKRAVARSIEYAVSKQIDEIYIRDLLPLLIENSANASKTSSDAIAIALSKIAHSHPKIAEEILIQYSTVAENYDWLKEQFLAGSNARDSN